MTLGDDPFRKRDAPPDAGAQQQHGQPPYGSGPAHGCGQPPYGGQPYAGYPPYAGSQPPYGSGGYPPPYGSPYPPPYGQPAGTAPSGNLGWAITAVVFFWPLAIAAFINYARVEPLWYRGDWAGAQRASQSVKRYGVIALCIGIAVIVLWLVFAVAIVGTTVTRSCQAGFSC